MTQDKIIATWTPSKWVFFWRSIFGGLLTFVLFSCVALGLGAPVTVTPVILLICVAFYMFVFDDYVLWNQHRNEVWTLSRSELVLIDQDDPATPTALPLDNIQKIRRWFWWSLTVKLTNGMSIEMNYLPQSGMIRKTILKTKKGLA